MSHAPAPASSTHSSGDGFHWLQPDAYFFDIDGTLLISRDRIHYRALNTALQSVYGADTTIDGVAYHGMTDLGILRAALERVGVSQGVFLAGLPEALEVVRKYVDDAATELTP